MFMDTKSHFVAYLLFLEELNSLLEITGIKPARLPVTAEIESKKNRLTLFTPETKQQVGRVIIYMENHLSEDLNLEQLAGEVSLSKYQLIRRFRDEEGTTPWKFLIGKRIEKVKELLEEGISPGQAAVESGFYDQSHLNKVFRENTGQTPKEYQEKNFKNRN